MEIALLTALGVGGATIIGAVIGVFIVRISHKINDLLLGFAAGVMLCAAVLGLILPSMEGGNIFITIIGILCGAVLLHLIDIFTPHLHGLNPSLEEKHPKSNQKLDKIFLFVIAIAIHNFPEGVAAGVGFGSGNTIGGLTIAIGIALQNIPEGMIIIAPMLAKGISKKKAFLIASLTGVIEIVGTVLGYFAVTISKIILPFALAFAGGTMLYIISDEMIPETHAHGNERLSTYALLFGFCLMLLMDFFIG